MNRNTIIAELKKYFGINELVCNHTYGRFAANSWAFIDTETLNMLLVLRRDIIKKPMICNDASHHQRGLRCNCCDLVKKKTSEGKNYLSAHILGHGFDFVVPGMEAKDVRTRIQECRNMLPCNVRIEDGVTWLHIDTLTFDKTDKVTLFKA